MDQPPALTPEEVSKLADQEYAQLGQPQSVKVFGILHVVFGCLGIVSTIWSIIASVLGKQLFSSEAATAGMQMQAEMQQRLLPVTLISIILSAVIAVLMLYAGVLLLKKRRIALQWSNLYAWTSLVGKAVNLVLALVFTLPVTSELMNQTGGASPLVPSGTMMVVGAVVGALVTSIYPILSLVLLNRPKTKAWFANQPL